MPRVGRAGRAPTAAAIPLPGILLTLRVILAGESNGAQAAGACTQHAAAARSGPASCRPCLLTSPARAPLPTPPRRFTVGWLQLRRFESHLAERAAERQQAELAGHEEQGYPSFKTAVQQGPQSSSALCAALLEAAGILPDAQGRRVGVDAAQEDGSAAGGAATREGAAGGAAAEAGAAAAVRYLHARRQLYDSMEAALLDCGLALGGCTGFRCACVLAMVGAADARCVGCLPRPGAAPPLQGAARPAAGAAGHAARSGSHCGYEFPCPARASKRGPRPLPAAAPAEASSTQGLGLGDMFTRDGQQLKPVLRELQVPVRAIVLPLRDRQAAG